MRPHPRCAVRAIPPAPDSQVRRLPTLLPGPGPRPDCRNEAECLGRWVRAHPVGKGHSEVEAVHCPPFCSSLEPIPAHHGLAAAHYYGSGERVFPASGYGDEEEDEDNNR